MRRLQNFEKIAPNTEERLCSTFILYHFWNHNFHHVVIKQRNNLAIFEFLKNRGLSFKTSDSNIRDLLDELFHMAEKKCRKKIKITGLISKSYKIKFLPFEYIKAGS